MRATRVKARFGAVVAALIAAPAAAEAHHAHRLRRRVVPPLDEPYYGYPSAPLPGIPYPEQPGPYPSGFAITVDAADASRPTGAIDKPIEAARALASCWTPPFAPAQATARFQFNRSGAIIGAPRIAFLNMGARTGSQDRDNLSRSILAAFSACAPLRFTPSFAAAIAGYPIALRFVARDSNSLQPRDR